MVRQVPFTEMESPSCASPRMVEHDEMVRDVPPPPEDVESRELSSVTAGEQVLDGSMYRIKVHDTSMLNVKAIKVARRSRGTHCLLSPRDL